jgi:MRG-binding protein
MSAPATAEDEVKIDEDVIPAAALDKWTDDQESALLRACVQWKPVGMHKHFRMIAIRNQLISDGLISQSDEHTSAAGIWKKLKTLYDLPSLDEREDATISEGPSGESDGYWRDFELPRDDFEALMWDRRLAPAGTSSPEMSVRESTVADTDEPRSSPVPSRASTRGRAGARKSGRLSRLQNEIETESRSKSASVADEDHHMEDADDDAEEESAEGEDESDEDEQEDEEKKNGSRRGGRGGRKAQRGGRRGRRRA